MRTIAGNPVLNFLVIHYLIALWLTVMYFLKVPPEFRTRSRARQILLLPSVGWGAWKHDVLERKTTMPPRPRISTVLAYMGRLHGWILLASMIISCVTFTGVFDPVDPEYERAVAELGSQDRFAVAFMTKGAVFATLFVTVGAYVFFFILLSVIPWVVGAILRGSYERRARLSKAPPRFAHPPAVPPPFGRG